MLIRTESDFTWVANASYDLANLVTTYLVLYRTYTNGNTIVIPEEKFAVTFEPSKKEGCITVNLWWTSHYTSTVTQYYDVDDDMFDEAWGSDNSCGYSTAHHESKEHIGINIPIAHLMRNEAQMKSDFVARAAKIKAAEVESQRLARIDELKNELTKLEKG